jgi:hypothetical protein
MPEPMAGVGLYAIVGPIVRSATPQEIIMFDRKVMKDCCWGADTGYIASVATMLAMLADHNIIVRVTPLGLSRKFGVFPMVALHYHTKNERSKAERILKDLDQPKIEAWYCWQYD